MPVDLIHARAVAAELQRRYDAGEWDPAVEVPDALQKLLSASATNASLERATARFAAGAPDERSRALTTRMNVPRQAAAATAPTVLEHARTWIETQRYESAPKDASRIELYIARSPIAALPITELRPRHVLAFVTWLGVQPSERGGTLAPRTIRSAYDVLRRALDAAVIYEIIPANPCAPIRGKLPSIEDKDPTARQGWLFTREEIVRLISDARVPEVRRVCYALQFLTGMRVGELAVLRWKDYDPNMLPLGRLTIARAVKSVSGREAATKTGAIKVVPVHPTLAVLLNAWKAEGWAKNMGRGPEPGDLVVPNQHGRVRNTNRHNRDLGRDCAKLGIPRRHQHAARHTFITLAQDDGADGAVLRWITHAPPRTAFDSYTRGQWQRLCAEISKLQIVVGSGPAAS